MLHLLADLPAPNPDFWWQLSLAISAAATTGSAFIFGINQWRKLTEKKEKPEPKEMRVVDQPLEVKLAETFATKTQMDQREHFVNEEIKRLDLRLDGMGGRIEENFRALDNKRSSSIAGLHKRIEEEGKGTHSRINEVLKAVTDLAGFVRGKIQ